MDLPVASDSAETPADTAPDIHGLAERAGRNSLLGWALDGSRPGHRLQLELRLGDQVISTGLADRSRADLEANGIGDGRHAFELPVAPELVHRVAEFRLFGLAADGSKRRIPMRVRRPEPLPPAAVVPAPAPAPAPGLAQEHFDRLKADVATLAQRLKQVPDGKALDDLIAQHAALAGQVRGLSAALEQRLASLASRAQMAEMTSAQAAVLAEHEAAADRLATLEAWVARLEQRAESQPASAVSPPQRAPGMDPWQKLLFAAFGGALATALLVSLVLRMM